MLFKRFCKQIKLIKYHKCKKLLVPDLGGQKWSSKIDECKEISCFEVLDVLLLVLRAVVFSCSLGVLYGG
jgi:hypothetical protein